MNINDIISQQGIIYDRYLGTALTLPHPNFDSIKIQPNETVTNFNINSIITKLYDNYLYLYKSAHVASNIIPLTAIATAGVYNGAFNWYRGLSSNQFAALSSIGLNPDKSRNLVVKYNSDLNQYIIFTSTGSVLLAYRSNNTFTSIVSTLSTNTIYQGSNIPWTRIHDITLGDNNTLYVLDQGSNSIVQYDASGFLTNSNLLQNILVYQNSIGGLGTFTDNTKFNTPASIDYFDSIVYVLDAGNSCIKTYDRNLNWLLTYRLFKDFLSAGPIQINHDNFGNKYVLNSNWTVYKYNNDFTTKQILDFTPLSAAGINVKSIVFSPSDSNVFYFVTDNAVYKKLVNNPDDTVGNYLLNRFNFSSKEQFTAFASVSASINGINYDYNFTALTLPSSVAAYTVNFTNTGSNTFTVPTTITGLTALIIAGGGSGNSQGIGPSYGGGAGGVLLSAINVTPGQVLNINVGTGGVYATGLNGVSGQSSSIVDILTAIGGGAGGTFSPPTTGGSGGGNLGTGNYGTPGQGNNGGNGTLAGGGGGAGGVGGNGTPFAGIGGIGIINPIPGSNIGQLSAGNYWIGGGGTGIYTVLRAGGLGGGGTGSGGNGTANTGGGGGAGNTGNGGSGGSGAVVLYYTTATAQSVQQIGKISLFQDNLNVTSVLTNDVFDVYSLSGITIDKEEYLQNWVINKSISKLLMNHMRLRDNISSKFLYDQSTIPGDTLLAGTRYLLPIELTALNFNQDVTNFIGVNEIFQNNIINRPFETVFNIQTNLLSALAADIRDYNVTPQIVYLS
jgi:hypothetical protein